MRKHKRKIDKSGVIFLIIVPTLIVFSICFLYCIKDYDNYKHPEQVECVDTIYTTYTGPVEMIHGDFEYIPTKEDLVWDVILTLIWTGITLAFSISVYKELV